MKYKDEVAQNGKPVFYAVLYDDMRKAAIECGYALALHGSMQNDMDMIAVAWTAEAKSEVELVKAVNACLGATIWVDHIFTTREVKPHGRITYTLFISGDWHIDLTVVAPAQYGQSELEEVSAWIKERMGAIRSQLLEPEEDNKLVNSMRQQQLFWLEAYSAFRSKIDSIKQRKADHGRDEGKESDNG